MQNMPKAVLPDARSIKSKFPSVVSLAIVVLAVLLACGTAWARAPIRIECVGDSITAGYTDNPTWHVPFEFGYRSGLCTRLTNAGITFQFVGASPEPWNGVFGVPTNTPSLDLRTIGQDHHRGYGGWGTSSVLSNIRGWLAADNPDVILLMIGINDGGSVTARTTLSNIVQTTNATAVQLFFRVKVE